MSFAAPTGADLNNPAAANDHRNHLGTAFGTIGAAQQFRMAVRTEEIDDPVVGQFVLRFDTVTSV